MIPAPGRPTDIRIRHAEISYQRFEFRTPHKFGRVTGSRSTVLTVDCEVETRGGRVARGLGVMSLGNTWAFKSTDMTNEQTLGAMEALAERCRRLCIELGEFGHPLDLGVALEARFLAAAAEVMRELRLPGPMPRLAVLVTGSAFDAAVHDAYGKAHGLNCYHTYGREFVHRDLGVYLGPDYAGQWLQSFVLREPRPSLQLYHLVGAVDPLAPAEVAKPVGDGLPENLPEWIRYNGLTHFKIKLNGNDLTWDLERVMEVDRLVAETQAERGIDEGGYSLDFNERCESVDYLIELLRRLRERTPRGFDRVQYVEQPTARDLLADPRNRMHAAAKLKPVVIDESLTDLESLMLAREMGYSGAALKACKGQTQSLLMAAAGQRLGMFLCVQDLTCTGAALIQSAGIAAHVPGVTGIEANSRQFCPEANRGWEDRFPGIFQVRAGSMDTSGLRGPGLGAG